MTASASIIAILFLGAGCNKSSPSSSPAPSSGSARAEVPAANEKEVQAFSHPNGARYKQPREFVPGPSLAGKTSRDPEYIIAWHRFNTVEEYKRVGRKNSAWDSDATTALEAYASIMSGHEDMDAASFAASVQRVAVPSAKAVAAGCDDPLIRYVHTLYVIARNKEKTPEDIEKAYGAAADALAQSDYPSIRKAFACYRAGEAFFNVHGHPPKAPPRAVHLMRASINYLSEGLFDKSMPPIEASSSCDTIVDEFDRKTAARHDMFGSLIPTLEKVWKDHAWAHYIIGRVYLAKAWEARGTGLARTVDNAGWDAMREHLKGADRSFNMAFEMDPTDWRPAVKMITVIMMDDGRRSEMEKWFDRAMTVNTNCYEAAWAKSFFLEPRWYGDRDDALEFARECVASKKWGGRVPLILPRLHASLQSFNRVDQATYYSDPQVWKDIDSAYKRYFELNPADVSYRHDYARDAYRCGQYAVFLEQLPLFKTGTNYNFFGSKESFDAMVRLAQQSVVSR